MGESNEVKIAKLEVQLDRIEKDTMEIKNLSDAVIKLTYIVDELKREKENRSVPVPEEINFWDTKAGQLVPVCIAVTLCIGALCIGGQRVAEVLKNVPIIK